MAEDSNDNKEAVKDFCGWHVLKQELDKGERLPTFHEREIWWCSIGLNIGFELFGKSKVFSRPVLVIRKFGQATFLGVPLTTSAKKGYYRYPYEVGDKKGSLIFDQVRTYDARRLRNVIEKVPEPRFEKIKQAMKACFNL